MAVAEAVVEAVVHLLGLFFEAPIESDLVCLLRRPTRGHRRLRRHQPTPPTMPTTDADANGASINNRKFFIPAKFSHNLEKEIHAFFLFFGKKKN